MKKISIIVPIYNEENIVEELMRRILKSAGALPYNFEFLFVDDGSSDNTLSLLLDIQKKENRLKIIKLSRNWGYQNAFNAGIDYADADAAILIDGDLEDPPEIIKLFLEKWEEGFDIVYAVKETRCETRLKKLLFSIFYSLMERFSNVRVDRQSGMFSLMDRKVISELKKFKERYKYYVGLRAFVGFKKTQIFYHREKRHAGKPKQDIGRLINYGMDALFSFSFLPIRLLTYFGLFILFTITIFSVFLITIKIFKLQGWIFYDVPGWTSIIMITFFILAIQIIFLGIIGEYIARIFDEVRNRPYYIVEKIFENKGKMVA